MVRCNLYESKETKLIGTTDWWSPGVVCVHIIGVCMYGAWGEKNWQSWSEDINFKL